MAAPNKPDLVCRTCFEQFPSKTKLFKHLRTSETCNENTGLDLLNIEKKVCIIFGFYNSSGNEEELLQQLIDPDLPNWKDNKGFSRAAMSVSPWFSQQNGSHAKYDVLTYAKEVPKPRLKDPPFNVEEINAQLPNNIQIYTCHYTPLQFHAYNGIQLRVYNYLVPLNLLLPDHIPPSTQEERNKMYDPDQTRVQVSHNSWSETKTNTTFKPAKRFHEFYKDLKRIIRRFQGEQRFHNYVPELSPTMDQSLMILQKVRAKKLLVNGTEYVEFSCTARRFLKHMVCRIFGLLIAVTKQLLPAEYIEFSLNDGFLAPVPEAPVEFLYLNKCCYWKEFLNYTLFSSRPFDSTIDAFEQQIKQFTHSNIDNFQTWANEILPVFCEEQCFPAYLEQTNVVANNAFVPKKQVPPSYEKALKALRTLSESGSWPETTTGRIKVIQKESLEHGGSFSMGYFPLDAPRNDFIEFMHDIFELEATISPHRTLSSTVAINRHAQFKPHYDKGDGSGQSISLIVGLGDYAGGELVVEGTPCDIQYAPLEFNGCTQRHWTKPFVGERFSLVFFTPQGCEGKSGLEFARERLEHAV